jgi:DNA-binding MarR family transcriptional regulator
VSSLEFAYGVLAGLAVAAALYALLWWLARRSPDVPPRATGFADPGNSVSGPPVGPPAPSPVSPGPSAVPPEEEVNPPGPTADPGSAPRPVELLQAAKAQRSPGDDVSPTGSLRLSQRVILHVYAQGVQVTGGVAAAGLCQAGMVEALGIPQAGLAAVLRRLEAAGILIGERGHVRGHDRRLKVYRLSPRGVQLAQELRTRSHRAERA